MDMRHANLLCIMMVFKCISNCFKYECSVYTCTHYMHVYVGALTDIMQWV